jgi:hypothetical protein
MLSLVKEQYCLVIELLEGQYKEEEYIQSWDDNDLCLEA